VVSTDQTYALIAHRGSLAVEDYPEDGF